MLRLLNSLRQTSPVMLAVLVAIVGAIAFFFPRSSPEAEARVLRDFVASNFSVSQPVHIRFGDRGFVFPDLVEAAQAQLDFRLRNDGISHRYPLVDELPKRIERLPEEEDVVPDFVLTDDVTDEVSRTETEPVETGEIEARSTDLSGDSGIIPRYVLELLQHGLTGMWMDLEGETELKSVLTYDLDVIHRNDIPFFVTQALYDNLLLSDLLMHEEVKSKQFSDYQPEVYVNFVAAEDQGISSDAIKDEFESHMAQYERVAPFVRINSHFHTMDVTKARAKPNWIRNTTNELTYFYLTSMKGYANSIQGVYLHHIDRVTVSSEPTGDPYGTDYLEQQKRANTATYDVSSFLEQVASEVEEHVHLPGPEAANIRLRAESAMKHFTLKGIVSILDQFLAGKCGPDVYKKICALVDQIMTENEHDWLRHLRLVSDLSNSISA